MNSDQRSEIEVVFFRGDLRGIAALVGGQDDPASLGGDLHLAARLKAGNRAVTHTHNTVAQLANGDHRCPAFARAIGTLGGGKGDAGGGLGDSLEELLLVGSRVGFTSFDVGRFGVVTSVEGEILNGHPFVGFHKVEQFLPNLLLTANLHGFCSFGSFGGFDRCFGRHLVGLGGIKDGFRALLFACHAGVCG